MSAAEAREQFLRIARLPDERIDLAEAALWVAAEQYDGLDVPGYLARLADFAERARPSVSGADTLAQRIAALNRFLYDEQSFRGNRSDYYDARNSFLNEVIDRRTGIPLTLAVVYLSVAERLGLPVHGVGFPGHFLLKCAAPDEIVIDPFEGTLLTRADCEARWRATLGAETPFDARALEPAPARQTLARLVGNLKQIFLAQQDWPRALACVERILALEPDAALELRDRGLLYARLECWSAAAADLQRFLALAPNDPTAEGVRQQLVELIRSSPALN
jgi:regulator of sirC expression with transglutaminase-like and TPR domain